MSDEGYITVLDIALHKGAKKEDGETISANEFMRIGLPFFAGCQDCQASLAPYNSYPSKTGYIKCSDCIETSEMGFSTVEEFDAFMDVHNGVDKGEL